MTQKPNIPSILEKVKKLLALATSSNPHEAASAAAKAQELLSTYNLELSQVETDHGGSGYGRTTLEIGPRKWRHELLHVIAANNFCQTLQSGKRAILIGERHNSEVVEYLYTYLASQLETMATQAYHQAHSDIAAITWKDSFFAGAIISIHDRLRAERQTFEESESSCRALVVTKEKEIQEAIHQMFPNARIRTARAKSVVACTGYDQGVEAGKHIALRRAITE